MEDDVQRKLDEYNELLLRNTALTFSTEGVTRDLKAMLARKADFVAQAADAAARLAAAPCKSSDRSKAIDELVRHVVEEVKGTNSTINFVIMKVIEREQALSMDEKEDRPRRRSSPKKMARKKPRDGDPEQDGTKGGG